MDLLTHLTAFKDAMDDYHDLLVAEAAGVGDHQYLAEGAGLRLREKPRKNVIRIELAMEDLRTDAPKKARQHLRTVYGAWWDHVGLHDTYIDTHQMSVEHVLAHFGGQLTEEAFKVPHTEVVTGILNSMGSVATSFTLETLEIMPDAWSLGVALCAALAEVDRLIG